MTAFFEGDYTRTRPKVATPGICVSLAKTFELRFIGSGHLDECLILMEPKMRTIVMLKRDA